MRQGYQVKSPVVIAVMGQERREKVRISSKGSGLGSPKLLLVICQLQGMRMSPTDFKSLSPGRRPLKPNGQVLGIQHR